MRLLVLDNYDSFTYNLVQYLKEITGQWPTVTRNDAISLDEVAQYDVIILSPGPGLPAEAGIMPALIQRYAPNKPILGVCLGHQAIAEAFGGELYNLSSVYHGVATPARLTTEEESLFWGIPRQFQVARYHSWAVVRDTLPDCLQITASDSAGTIMALTHTEYPVKGVQFHPESIMAEHGKQMLRNFLQLSGAEAPINQPSFAANHPTNSA